MGCHSSNSFVVFLVTKHRRKDSILAQKIPVQKITCFRTDLQYNMDILMSIFDSSAETNLLIKWLIQSSTSRRKINYFIAKDFHD